MVSSLVPVEVGLLSHHFQHLQMDWSCLLLRFRCNSSACSGSVGCRQKAELPSYSYTPQPTYDGAPCAQSMYILILLRTCQTAWW